MNLEKVFAYRTENSGPPKLAFCTKGIEWATLNPTENNYKNTRNPGLQDMFSNGRTEPFFLHHELTSFTEIGCR